MTPKSDNKNYHKGCANTPLCTCEISGTPTQTVLPIILIWYNAVTQEAVAEVKVGVAVALVDTKVTADVVVATTAAAANKTKEVTTRTMRTKVAASSL